MKLPKLFQSKLFLIGVIIVLLGIFTLELQQWQQRRKIDAEIDQLRTEQADLEQRNKALSESLEYFSSNTYQEKLAREQLGLKKEGEIVVNFPSGGIVAQPETSQQPAMSNPKKWWNYIFNNT